MSIQFFGRALIVIILATSAAGCGADGPNGAAPDPTVEPSAGTPSREGTGHERPAPTGGKQPAIEIAGGPAGDGGYTENDDGSLCMDVRWLGGQDDANLGEGIAFTVTQVRLTGARRANFSCPDDPCRGFTFDSNSDNCSHAVRPGASKGTLSLYGRIRCSAPAQACAEFRSRLRLRTIPIPPSHQDEESEPDDEPAEPEPSDPGRQPSPVE